MTKIYHFSNQLIIIDKVYKSDKYDTMQTLMLRVLRAPVKTVYDAHEIWMYNHSTKHFEAYKNKNGVTSLLEEFFAGKGINIKCDAADMLAQSRQYRFKEPKDEFLFNLKF